MHGNRSIDNLARNFVFLRRRLVHQNFLGVLGVLALDTAYAYR